MMKKIIPFVIMIVLITGCARFQNTDETPNASTPTGILASPTPTVPISTLTVCLGAEPNSLYPFGELNAPARSVLAAIYNGPINTIDYEYQPVILTELPTLENGDAQITRITVQPQSEIVDANGNIVTLETGVKVKPADCRSDDCVITYDGTDAIEMDQMIVTFRMRQDLTWSDGTPVVADDSIYSFQIQADTNVNSYLIDRTQIYEAADTYVLQWFGIPGFIDPTFFTNFWQPAPRHVWSEFSADQLSSIDIASRTPTGWGPYMVKEWIPNDHITLEKNPYYFRTQDGFPKTDEINFRFISDPDIALTELIAGRCDVLDPSINLDNHVGLLQEMQSAEQAQAFVTTGMSVEWLGLGLNPASYDNGYVVGQDRPNYFEDVYARQAIAYCLNRQAVVDNVLFGFTSVPASYVPVNHPTYDSNLDAIPYDPEVGISLLEQAGWQDHDDDPSTPRRAISVRNVAYNVPLELNYYTTSTAQRRQVTAILEDSLAECGIGLNIQYFSQNELYSPNGLLFGRQFDLAEYALGVESVEAACHWFMSSEIPNAENEFIGTNITGFQDEEYDSACRTAQGYVRGEQEYLNQYRQTQIIFAEELPAIPLFYRLRIAAARPDVCGFALDATANPLWNIEDMAIGETCQN
jgi:peptide/nickel transport system substrate-binding protein